MIRSRLAMAMILLALPGWLGGAALAQEPFRLTARIQPDRGVTDTQPVQFVIQVEGAANPQVKPPSLAGLENLTVIGGPGTNSSFVWSGGQASSKYQVIYTLLAKAPGPAVIPALDVEVDGKTYRTDPIRFTVLSGPSGSSPEAAVPGRPPARAGQSPDVFLKVELGAEEVWVGEPVPLTVTLYAAARISSPVWRQQPTFANFWVEDVDVNPDDEAVRTRIDGRVYTAYPVERKLLIPSSPGEFELDPYVAQMQVRLSGSDLFDMLSLGRSQTVIRKTEPIRLRVKALPSGQPADFSGAVGSYSMQAHLDRTEALVNDAVALRVTISGRGSLRSVAPPEFRAPSELNTFEPKLVESSSKKDGGLASTRTWEWILVPLTSGEIHLPELRFSYFDPRAGAYQRADSPPLLLSVERGEGGTDTGVARGGIQIQRRDLAFIKPLRGQLREATARAHERGWFVLSLVLPLALVPLVVLVGRARARLQQDQGLSRARRARTKARKRFQTSRRKLEQVDSATFHEEVARALVEYVADRFNLAAAGLTYDVADELLGSRAVDAALRRRFRSCMETCDFARFVPAAGAVERRGEVLDEAVQIVEQLERAL